MGKSFLMHRVTIILLLLFGITVQQRTFARQFVNPINYGIKNAKTGEERYNILLKCHEDAIHRGCSISYNGLRTLELEIPSNPKSIPLPPFVDFADACIKVKNNQKDFYLFEMKSDLEPVEVNGTQIDCRNYQAVKSLRKGLGLLVIKDNSPWVENRRGHNYGHTRRDIVLVENGVGKNGPISSYSTESSKPAANFRPVSKEAKIIKNIRFKRSKGSTYKTYLVHITNQYNISLERITIVTPDDKEKYGDVAIRMTNCYDVELSEVSIYGTYSQERKFGYGISLNNVYGLHVKNMYARAKWGVFGTNNLQNVKLEDCDINRFDIHCYGRNVRAENCKFSGLYNQFSSIYGRIDFEGCEFKNFVPVLIEASYNAYTPFELMWNNCVFYIDEQHNYLMTLSGVPRQVNSRPELNRKCLPNIAIKGCKVIVKKGTKEWYIVKTGGVNYKNSFDYISEIDIKDIMLVGDKNAKFKVFSEYVKTTKNINLKRYE